MARFSALGRIDTGTTGCARLIRESKLSCIIHGRASLLSSPRHAASFESGTFGIPSQDGEGEEGEGGEIYRALRGRRGENSAFQHRVSPPRSHVVLTRPSSR